MAKFIQERLERIVTRSTSKNQKMIQNTNYLSDINSVPPSTPSKLRYKNIEKATPYTPRVSKHTLKDITDTSQNTPIKDKMLQIQYASSNNGMLTPQKNSMNLLSCTTILADKFLTSTPIKNLVTKNSGCELLTISGPMDYIANNLIMQMRDAKVERCNKSSRINVHKQHNISEDIIILTCAKIYNTGSKSAIIPALGSYSDIAKQAKDIMKGYGIDDKTLAECIGKVEKGEKLDPSIIAFSDIARKFIVALSTLLFGEEALRNTSSYFINHMFVDLIKSGEIQFKDLPTKLPMAITEAVMAARALSNKSFEPIKSHAPYDQSTKMHELNSSQVNEVLTRSHNILKKWLLQQEGVTLENIEEENLEGENLEYIVEILKTNGIFKWYNHSLKPCAIFSNEEEAESNCSNSPYSPENVPLAYDCYSGRYSSTSSIGAFIPEMHLFSYTYPYCFVTQAMNELNLLDDEPKTYGLGPRILSDLEFLKDELETCSFDTIIGCIYTDNVVENTQDW